MFPRSPIVYSSPSWDAVERSLAALARAQKLCEQAERIRKKSEDLRAASLRLCAAQREFAHNAAASPDTKDLVASPAEII